MNLLFTYTFTYIHTHVHLKHTLSPNPISHNVSNMVCCTAHVRKDTRRKGSQWGFVIPMSLTTTATVDHLSNLSINKDALYVAFAICNDDSGNSYLQGYVKTSRRCRVGVVKSLIGQAIFTNTPYAPDVLIEIYLKPNFKESGDAGKEAKFRENVTSFKYFASANYTIDQLMESFPHICTRYPGVVHRYIK